MVQVAVMYLIAFALSRETGHITDAQCAEFTEKLKNIPAGEEEEKPSDLRTDASSQHQSFLMLRAFSILEEDLTMRSAWKAHSSLRRYHISILSHMRPVS